MRAAILSRFIPWSISHEGYCPFPYCDGLNLVTVGIGNLIDAGARNGNDCGAAAMAPAMGLPWFHEATGAPATPDEIRAAWMKCKQAGIGARGGFAYERLTDLRLSKEAVATLCQARLLLNDSILAQLYPGFEEYPADAQFAMHSIAWACGAASPFPKVRAALAKTPPDFATAAEECAFHGGGEGPTSRNAQNTAMFLIAQATQDQCRDPDVLYWLDAQAVTSDSAQRNATPAGSSS